MGTDNYGLSGPRVRASRSTLHGTDGDGAAREGRARPAGEHRGDEAAAQGSDLHLTLDAAIQERVEAVLAEVGQTYTPKGATALVMDPRNGAILALANWPRVNANDPGGAPAYAQQDRAVTVELRAGLDLQGLHGVGRAPGRPDHPRHAVRPAAGDQGGRPHDQRGARARGAETLHGVARSSPSRPTSAR